MVKIPYIKIPSVRVGSIGPTSNIGAGGATPAPPPPVTYLTQWQMMGNSVVHTDEYLTQWKVEGNSVVDNNAILSCGDLGQDNKYHVKISNGVDVFDIALTEPLRKVGDVADKIEFVNGVATLIRKTSSIDLGSCTYYPNANGFYSDYVQNLALKPASGYSMDVLCAAYPNAEKPWTAGCMGISLPGSIWIGDTSYESVTAIKNALAGVEMIYKLETPTTEVIQAPQISVSPTNTYTSANDTSYSAFEYKKNVEIWSCGEYSAVDGKYHILVQPLGGNIADIALDEPLRKVNNVADSIEFADDVATLTRRLTSIDMGSFGNYARTNVRDYNDRYGISGMVLNGNNYPQAKYPSRSNVAANMLTAIWNTETRNNVYIPRGNKIISMATNGTIILYDEDFNDYNSYSDFQALMQEIHPELIYELANPTTETIQVPHIEKADSYSCVISQGGKAVEWSSFETE